MRGLPQPQTKTTTEMLDITEEQDDVLFPISDQEAAKTLLPSGKSQIELSQGWLPTVINCIHVSILQSHVVTIPIAM